MHTVAKKVYMSILTCIVILLTMVATTYAWVGILTSGQVSGFDLNLKVDNTNTSYNLLISGDGFNFGESVSLANLQKQILENTFGYSGQLEEYNDSQIDFLFRQKARLNPSSTSINQSTKALNDFYSIDFNRVKDAGATTEHLFKESNDYYYFEIYLTVDPIEGLTESTEINANVFLNNIGNTIVGTKSSGFLTNGNPFTSLPSDEVFNVLKNVPDYFNVDSANAARVALSFFQPKKIDDDYSSSDTPINTIIYQGGTQNPRQYDDIFDLGGILPAEHNLALRELNSSHGRNIDLTSDVIGRQTTDLELIEANRFLWSRADTVDTTDLNYLGISNQIHTKIKIGVYFWFEGWDADCLYNIENREVQLNLSFSTDSNSF